MGVEKARNAMNTYVRRIVRPKCRRGNTKKWPSGELRETRICEDQRPHRRTTSTAIVSPSLPFWYIPLFIPDCFSILILFREVSPRRRVSGVDL